VTTNPQIRWSSAARTDVGKVRSVNEDSCLERPERGLWAVADGMGGHMLGDLASRMVINALDEIAAPDNLESYMADVREQLRQVNNELRGEAATRHTYVIGSTVVVLVAWGTQCGILWAGDSRIYLYRDGNLRKVTRDHSQVEDLLASGSITPEEAAFYPGRNLITRAVGAANLLEVDADMIDVFDNDIYLLCSDGLTNEVSEEDIRRVLASGDCRQIADTLVDMALQEGGHDNVSAIVICAHDLSSGEQTVLNPAV